MAMQSPIPILGAGSWGTAIALHLSRLGKTIPLWTHDKKQIKRMQNERVNQQYMANHPFLDTIVPVPQLREAIQEANEILIAVPSIGFRPLLSELKLILPPQVGVVWLTKGMDQNTGQLLHEVAVEILGNTHPLAVLSGPSFASEVAAGLPTAVVIASHDVSFAEKLSQQFNSSTLRVYFSRDVVGVEVGGVVKNVIAIGTGISDGMGFGTNARCALITRGLAEMIRLGVALGGQYETFTGLTGLGDLVLTCTDNQSRNRRFGLLLGEGKAVEQAIAEIGQVVEGQRNAELVIHLAQKHNVDMPITDSVVKIIQGKINAKEAMQFLFAREMKAES